MAMPNNLIIVRHGQSEGNLANKMSREGDHSAFTDEFRSTSSSEWRLTEEGILQATKARDWLQENFQETFDRRYASEYVRAVETAFHLQIEGGVDEWFLDMLLRERDYGFMDSMPDSERREMFRRELALREKDPYTWAPPGGESIASTAMRADRIFQTMHRECAGKNVIMVCHGEMMWAIRIRAERMPQFRYRQLYISDKPQDHIHNCQIIQYTRIDPKTGEQAPYFCWMRSVCPWDTSLSSNEWEIIYRPRYTNEELSRLVDMYPKMIGTESLD